MDMSIRTILKQVALKQLYRIQDCGIPLKYGGNILFIGPQKQRYGIALN